MAVPTQFVVNGDSEVLGLCCFLQSMAMNIIGRLNDVALDCRVKRFTENAVHCGAVSSVRFTIRSFFIVGSVRFILSFLSAA